MRKAGCSFDDVFLVEMERNNLHLTPQYQFLKPLPINRGINYYLIVLLTDYGHIIKAAVTEKPVFYWHDYIRTNPLGFVIPKVDLLDLSSNTVAKELRKKAKEINANKVAYSRKYKLALL
jgi:hypothetical protein